MKITKCQWMIHAVAIVWVFSWILLPQTSMAFSNSFWGALASILLILFYATIDRLYGLLVLLVFVLYYQETMSMNEGFTEYSPNIVNVGATPTLSNTGIALPVENDPSKAEFKQKFCHLGKLMYKGFDISKESAQHVYPELKFGDDGICDPCEPACKYSIAEVTDFERTILPKSSKDWMSQIFE